MNDEFFPVVESWSLPKLALKLSMDEMSLDGQYGNEGVALWLGRRKDKIARITHVIVLRGKGITKHPDLLIIEDWLFDEVTDIAIDQNVSLIGQIHSHGKGHGTDLSLTDRIHGIAVPYYLSLVAPDYAQNTNTNIEDCGVHIFEKNIGYRRMTKQEIFSRIELIDDTNVKLLKVGNDNE